MKEKSYWKTIAIIIGVLIIGLIILLYWNERHQVVMGINHLTEKFLRENFEDIEHVQVNEQ